MVCFLFAFFLFAIHLVVWCWFCSTEIKWKSILTLYFFNESWRIWQKDWLCCEYRCACVVYIYFLMFLLNVNDSIGKTGWFFYVVAYKVVFYDFDIQKKLFYRALRKQNLQQQIVWQKLNHIVENHDDGQKFFFTFLRFFFAVLLS